MRGPCRRPLSGDGQFRRPDQLRDTRRLQPSAALARDRFGTPERRCLIAGSSSDRLASACEELIFDRQLRVACLGGVNRSFAWRPTNGLIRQQWTDWSSSVDRFVVISGCSSGGKSTLIAELGKRGHAAVEEPGRRIVKEELASGGSALPWVDRIAFALRHYDGSC